ncbi:alkylmercury lyase family protein [Pseudonocardia sp. CA-107938]|uniref:alkylmercury lyase family protein n=1 Tax=Pseudonocardia sp. CA-107938 TaxID=3240021 RepID=UPI003D8EAB1B
MTLTLEILHVAGCPNLAPLLQRLRQVTDVPVTTREIHTTAEAITAGMAGSPTLLVNDRDPFKAGEGREDECGLSCRIYRDEQGHTVPVPSTAQLRAALAAATPVSTPTASTDPAASTAGPVAAVADCGSCEPGRPGRVLSAWRTRALPLDPVEKGVHQTILRAFAATGRAPTSSELAWVVEGSGRAVVEVLGALHELDAVRLGGDGQIAVAYPFSARPTRHRVRIDDRVDAYAMCAIDALGIVPMLGADTRIDSIDITSDLPVTVTMIAGHTTWTPAGAVVFIGAEPGGGPSADCCCDYLNFFTDHAAATAWTTAHPHLPGAILDRVEAQQLGAHLFGTLLTT